MIRANVWALVALAVAGVSARAEIKAWPKPALVLEGHEKAVRCVAFSPDGRLLASAGNDGTICMWSMPSGMLVTKLDTKSRDVWRLFFVDGGKALLAFGGGERPDLALRPTRLTWWDVKTWRELRRLDFADSARIDAYLSPDGKTLLTGGDSEKDPVTKLRDAVTGKVVGEWKLPDFHTLTFTPDGKRVVVAGDPGRITVYDFATRKVVRRIEFNTRRGFGSLAVSPDGKTLAVSIHDAMAVELEGLTLFDLASGEPLGKPKAFKASGEAGLRFVRKGEWLLVLWYTHLVVIHPKTGERLTDYARLGNFATINDMAVSADGEWVAAPTGHDGGVKVWRLNGW